MASQITYMWSTWSRNPNNCTAIARTGNYVVMTKPEKCQDMYKHSIDNVQSKWYTNIFLVDVVRNKPRYPKFSAFSIKNSTYTYQEFLNLGALSSFELSAKENLDATAQPLQDKVVSHCKLTHQILLAILNNIEEKKQQPELDIIDVILMPREHIYLMIWLVWIIRIWFTSIPDLQITNRCY